MEPQRMKTKGTDMYWIHPTHGNEDLTTTDETMDLLYNHTCILNRLPGVEAGANKRYLGQIFQRL